MSAKTIAFAPRRKGGDAPLVINADTIRYIQMKRNYAEVHLTNGAVFTLRITMEELEQHLGDDFIKVHRSCLVAVRAIHSVENAVVLNSGEQLEYVVRQKKRILEQLQTQQKRLILTMQDDTAPTNAEEYHEHYKSFDAMPFAFTDIEMVFDEERRAVDWIFRYANPALAKLEKLPLESLIDHSIGSLFANMYAKWLRSYERAVLYGEMLEIFDYSPKVDTYLKVTCFPTFAGHCGCILFNVQDFSTAHTLTDSQKSMMMYLGISLGRNR